MIMSDAGYSGAPRLSNKWSVGELSHYKETKSITNPLWNMSMITE
jgi:hypothetical protein